MDNPSKLPPDDPNRSVTIARSDGGGDVQHIGLAGGTYTILVGGKDTAGRFCLIEMNVPPGAGPPPHRHDFEETFSLLEGELEVTCRGATVVLRAGETVNVPANAPHRFQNKSDKPVRMLCICAPAGQEEFFLQLGVPVASRTSPAPPMDEAERARIKAKGEGLAPKYRTEFVPEA